LIRILIGAILSKAELISSELFSYELIFSYARETGVAEYGDEYHTQLDVDQCPVKETEERLPG
jgi:hypothetical protein